MKEVFLQVWSKKYYFLSTFFLVFTLSYIVLVAIDFLPEAPSAEVEQTDVEIEEVFDEQREVDPAAETTTVRRDEEDSDAETIAEHEDTAAEVRSSPILPQQIFIPKLDRTISVLNPVSREIADLDAALLDGVVRHPDSAHLAQKGNVFILGHSSYLPNVFNKSFQAFNGIQDLVWGDIIEVTSGDTLYEYQVEKVYRAQAQDTTVPVAGTSHRLILATCNSFGSVDDRYVVEAKRIKPSAS